MNRSDPIYYQNGSNNSINVPDSLAYSSLLIASVFWGGNYLPVKHYETGDGMFFQLVICIAIWICGVAINIFKKFPRFYALPVFGGFLWTSGNMFSVPIIKFIGIGLGSLFWSIIGLITGWCTARFGLFGIAKEIARNDTFDIIGVVLSVASIILFLFVKFDSAEERLIGGACNQNQNLPQISYKSLDNNYFYKSRLERLYDNCSPAQKQIIGTTMSIFAGIMFGVSYTPIIYIQNNYPNSSQDYNDYSFSFATGIFISSLGYFVIYALYEKNNPQIYPQTILPGLVTGFLWSVANFCYFLATNGLSQAITFPITNCGPSTVAFVIALIYKEVKGLRNYLFIFCGIIVAIIGSVFCGLSK